VGNDDSPELLHAVLEGSLDAMLLSDDEGRYVDANTAACRLFGMGLDELLRHKATDFRGSDPREPGDVWRHFLDIGHLGGQTAFTRPDGARRILEVKATANVAPGLHLLVLRDLTERVEAEERLRDNQSILESAQVLAHVGTWVRAVDGAGTRSPEMARICGQPPDDALSDMEKHLLCVHPDDRELVRRKVEEALERGEPYANEYRIVRPDGEVRWVESYATALPARGAYPARIVGAVQDVTDRRKLIEGLRGGEQRYRRLLDAISDGVLLIAADGRITLANRHMAEMLGCTVDELIGESTFTFLQEEDHGTATARLARRRRGLSDRYVGRMKRKDGSVLHVAVQADPIVDAKGQMEGTVSVIEDLSERLAVKEVRGRLAQTEEQLRQAQKMEAIGVLAGGVAHDFNNILSVILSYAELLRDDLPAGDPRRADLEEIHKAGEKAAGLTRQLLAFSRKQVLRPRVLDLNETLAGTEKLLRRLLGEDIELVLEAAEGLGRVHADAGQIEQVLMNLVVNARDAMPRGGALTLRTADVDVDCESVERLGVPPGAYVCVTVTDTGCGMDAATQARIFEPFFTTKEAGKGTGLGLSTVFGIVEQSGGRVTVASAPGKGTTFCVYLPRKVEEPVAAEEAPPPRSRLEGTETVLLVEDDEQVRRVVVSTLRRQGYELLVAADGSEALRLMEEREGPVHLLLTDVVMPRMSGRDLAETLKNRRPGIRVLFMSGYTKDAVLRHGVSDGSVAFVQKPVTPEALATRVRQALDLPLGSGAE
jgi:two-component system cell cycle sensor histidine kinase/response regulator CckA